MNTANLNSFLKFGYFLDYSNPRLQFNFSKIDKNRYRGFEEDELVEIANRIWFKTIESQFKENEKHVVPLSGGLDSRAILSTLLKFTDASNIDTYTFGTPETFDYEIGKQVAKKAGTKHHLFNLTDYKYSQDELIDISKRIDNQTLLFLHAPIKHTDNLFKDHNVWSGAIIDVFFGRHTHKLKGNDIQTGIENSFAENQFVKSIDLTNVDDNQFHQFIDFDPTLENKFPYEHIIDLLNRQLKFIEPHVMIRGYNYRTLLSDELIEFATSIEDKWLVNQYLYKNMFLKKHPALFSLPTKTYSGLPLDANKISKKINSALNLGKKSIDKIFNRTFNRNINYIDFNKGIRERDDIKQIIYTNIMDLKHRDILPWIDIDSIWDRHMNSKVNHSDALLVLASLEINIKAGKVL